MVEQGVELDAGNPAVPMGSAIRPSYDFGMFKKVTWDLSPLRRRYLEEKYDLSQKRVDNLLKYNLTQALRNDLLETVDRPRTVDMNAVGSKGGGKCSRGIAILVIKDENGNVLIKTLSDIYNERLWKKGFKILSFNPKTGRVGWRHFVVCVNGRHPLLRIKTRCGNITDVTYNHPFLSFDTDYKWVDGSMLKKGDKIGRPRVFGFDGLDKINLNKAKLLAYLIADGSLATGSPRFAKHNSKMDEINEFIDIINVEFNDTKVSIKEKSDRPNNFEMHTSKKGFGNGIGGKNSLESWIISLGLNVCSNKKFIPNVVMESSNNVKKAFLNRLFTCDGGVCKPMKDRNSFSIEYSTISHQLAKDVSLLLSSFGIISTLRPKSWNGNPEYGWRINIDGQNAVTFMNVIGLYGTKEAYCKDALKQMEAIKRNPNYDTIPKGIWTLIHKKALAQHKTKKIQWSPNHHISRDKLLKIADLLDDDELKKYATDDVYWDEVESVTPIGEEETYAVEVEDNHTHIIDGIISHNSTFLLKCQEEHYRYLYKVAPTEALDTSDVSYIIERVFFIQDYLIRYVRQSPKLNTTCLQLDERAYTLGDSSFANLKRITNLTETLRKRKINFFYASPKIRWNFEYEYVIEPLEINERYKILHSAIFDKDMRLLGSLYTRKCDDRLEEAYNKVKEEFMTAVSEGKLRTMEYEEMAREILAAYPDLEELYMDEMRYRVEMERYQGLDAKSRRTYGKPIPPMDKMTKEKMIYYINKVNADYTGTEKMMIMEEVKQILSQKRKEGLAKMADETAKAVLEDTVSKEETGNKDSGRGGVIKEVMGNLGKGSVIELGDGKDDDDRDTYEADNTEDD